jgi:pimeloyl-ACP methyl ester carboxylesterase
MKISRAITELFSPFFYFNHSVNFIFKWHGLTLKTLKKDGFIIEYWESNNNKPNLLLLQAFAAESKYSWHKQIGSLAKKHHLIIPNLIYFGGSTMEPKSYAIADQVKAVQLLVDYLKLTSFALSGSSYGGVIAIGLANQNKEKIEKMILTNGPIKYDSEEDINAILVDFGLTEKAQLLVPQNYLQLHKLFGISYHKKPPVPAFFFKGIHRNLYANSDDKRKLVAKSSEELALLREIEYDFKFPILLIWGEEDRLAPLRIGKALKADFGDKARLVIMPKTAHMPNFEKPRAYNRIMNAFLDED